MAEKINAIDDLKGKKPVEIDYQQWAKIKANLQELGIPETGDFAKDQMNLAKAAANAPAKDAPEIKSDGAHTAQREFAGLQPQEYKNMQQNIVDKTGATAQENYNKYYFKQRG